MVVHCEDFASPLCEVIGGEQLLVALRAAMDRAETYGFTNRGPICLFSGMMFLAAARLILIRGGRGVAGFRHRMQRGQQIDELCLDRHSMGRNWWFVSGRLI